MKFESLRSECVEANLALVSYGLVDLTFGNVSVYDPAEQVFAIKPSGLAYDKLTPRETVVVDLDGNTVDGNLRPSSDTPTHRCLYIAFSHAGIRSVAHSHSRCAVAFAQAEKSIPCSGTTHADFFNGSVPVTRTMTRQEVEGDYEWETGKVILEAFENIDPNEIPGVLVRGHGPFAWGQSGAQAVEHAFALEIVADLAIKICSIDNSTNEFPDYLLNRHFRRKHGPSAYYGQSQSE